MGKVAREAADAIFGALVHAGSPLVKNIARSISGCNTSHKGLQEKVSGWHQRYDFSGPVRHCLWREGCKTIGQDTVIAVDSGTGRGVEADMQEVPAIRAVLHSPTRRVDATIRWRNGFFPVGASYMPVLVVSSAFGGKTLYLHALNFTKECATPDQVRKAAVLAANAHFCRWSVKVLF
ncbi:MAG: hypothetical protein IJ783_10620 [Kiritimatiellae bacterium]|nr:hypothetical protein [Kiritimatiellia bacterium]